jgi:NADH dehydrogenase/NADH:ubiquinone oxidoreductase subunit G
LFCLLSLFQERIGDKTRFSYDGLKRQRLDQPMVKGADGEFKPMQWIHALELLASKISAARGGEILGVVGDLVDAEAIVALKDLLNRLGSANYMHVQQPFARLGASTRAEYLFNSRIVGVESADAILFVGSNPRMESPVLAARVRKVAKQALIPVFSVGPEADLALKHTHLGTSSSALADLAAGKGPASETFKKAKRPMVIVGIGAFQGCSGAAEATQAALAALQKTYPNLVSNEAGAEWNGINVLHTSASRVAAQELGFVPGVHSLSTPAKVVYLLGAEELLDRSLLAPDAFVVYQGHHGDAGAEQADLVLPAPAYTEKSGTYINLEGRVQRTQAAVGRLANAREDWAILRALSEVLEKPLPYNTLEQVRERLVDVSPVFATYDEVEAQSFVPKAAAASSAASAPAAVTFAPYLSNYFMTDSISRSSKTMAKASATLPVARNSYKVAQTESEQQRQNQQGQTPASQAKQQRA